MHRSVLLGDWRHERFGEGFKTRFQVVWLTPTTGDAAAPVSPVTGVFQITLDGPIH